MFSGPLEKIPIQVYIILAYSDPKVTHWDPTLELKELSFFLIFIILQAYFNAPMCVDSENLCMGSQALLKKVRTPSKK